MSCTSFRKRFNFGIKRHERESCRPRDTDFEDNGDMERKGKRKSERDVTSESEVSDSEENPDREDECENDPWKPFKSSQRNLPQSSALKMSDTQKMYTGLETPLKTKLEALEAAITRESKFWNKF